MTDRDSVLVLGAGELGIAVLEGLANHPKKKGSIAVLLRKATVESQDPGKKAQNDYIKSLGVGIETGDAVENSVAELASIFRQFHTVISCTGFGLPPGTQAKLAKAALEAKVPRYFPWQWGVDYDTVGAGSAQDLFDEQLQVRQLLRAQSEVNWVIVSTGIFMSFLFQPEFGPVDLKERVLRGLGTWDTAVSVTTPHDIGVLAAEVVYDPRDISHQVVFVAGDTVTYGRLADLVEARFPGPFRRELWDYDVLRERLAAKPDNTMRKYQGAFGAGVGVSWDLSKTLNVQRGIPVEDVEQFVRKMVD